MGKYDNVMYRYLSDNNRFADFFNAVFFNGEEVLKGDMLEPDSERYVDVVLQENLECPTTQMVQTESGFRDIKKRLKTGERFILMAVENQNDIDYAMPWRIMRYDQMEYGRQIEEIGKRRQEKRKGQGLSPTPWTKRLEKEDRIAPIYTICFYHGMEPWDGPRSLKDMIGFPEETEVWQQHFHDYGMTLFCVSEPFDPTQFNTELRQLLEVMPLRQDKAALAELWGREEFACLDRETIETMAVLTDSMEILDKLEEYEEEGGYNMCLAVEEMRHDWKEEGRAEGIIEVGLDCGLSEGEILQKLQQKLDVSLAKAQEYLFMFAGQTV